MNEADLLKCIQYAFDVFEPHLSKTNHSLGCDIAMVWMKKLLGKELSEDEKLTVTRHLRFTIK